MRSKKQKVITEKQAAEGLEQVFAPPQSEKVDETLPWNKPLPQRKDAEGRRIPTTLKIETVPGVPMRCPMCEAAGITHEVSTVYERQTRRYGTMNDPPADRWVTAIIYECTKVTGTREQTQAHLNNKVLLKDKDIHKFYERYYT